MDSKTLKYGFQDIILYACLAVNHLYPHHQQRVYSQSPIGLIYVSWLPAGLSCRIGSSQNCPFYRQWKKPSYRSFRHRLDTILLNFRSTSHFFTRWRKFMELTFTQKDLQELIQPFRYTDWYLKRDLANSLGNLKLSNLSDRSAFLPPWTMTTNPWSSLMVMTFIHIRQSPPPPLVQLGQSLRLLIQYSKCCFHSWRY